MAIACGVKSCGTYCRGGPPWPPSVGMAPVNRGLIKTEGGHGGPPLQYVLPDFVYGLTKWALSESNSGFFSTEENPAWALPQALATPR